MVEMPCGLVRLALRGVGEPGGAVDGVVGGDELGRHRPGDHAGHAR